MRAAVCLFQSIRVGEGCRNVAYLFIGLEFDTRHDVAWDEAAGLCLLTVFNQDCRKQASGVDGKRSVFSNHLHPVGRKHLCHLSSVATTKRRIEPAGVCRVHRTRQRERQSRELGRRVGGNASARMVVPIQHKTSCCRSYQSDSRCQQEECCSRPHQRSERRLPKGAENPIQIRNLAAVITLAVGCLGGGEVCFSGLVEVIT